MKLLLFFVDGFGLGNDDKDNPARFFLNDLLAAPFTEDSVPHEFPEGVLVGADATGGVAGMPQSATGQTMLMTGANAPDMLGYHLTALPNLFLVDLVEERNMMKHLAEAGIPVTASNMYTPEFFERREKIRITRGRNALPVSSLCIRSSGASFRMQDEYHEGRALFTDLTNRFLRDRGYDIPLLSPAEAADRMIRILDEADFVFHEYFATDTYAHKKKGDDLERALAEIEEFITLVRRGTDPEETAILLVSDHGNCEDGSRADHNRNPVPVLLLSRNELLKEQFRSVRRLDEIKAAVCAAFGLPAEDELPPDDSAWV